MSEKKAHYYTSCHETAVTEVESAKFQKNCMPLAYAGLLILGHIADRLADLVLAVEEQTQAIISPDLPELKF